MVLPTPARPDDVHQPMGSGELAQRRQVAATAEQRADVAREVSGSGDWSRDGAVPQDVGALLEQLLLECAEFGSRLDAELIDQQRPQAGVRRERVSLPAAAVESRHERCPQTLTQWVLDNQRLELSDELAPGPEVHASGHHVLEETHPDLLQPGSMGSCPVTFLEEDLATKEGQPLARLVQRRPPVPSVLRRGGLSGEVDRSGGVHTARLDIEPVGVRLTHDELLVTEGPTQLGDLGPQRVATDIAADRLAVHHPGQPLHPAIPLAPEPEPEHLPHLEHTDLPERHRRSSRRRPMATSSPEGAPALQRIPGGGPMTGGSLVPCSWRNPAQGGAMLVAGDIRPTRADAVEPGHRGRGLDGKCLDSLLVLRPSGHDVTPREQRSRGAGHAVRPGAAGGTSPS